MATTRLKRARNRITPAAATVPAPRAVLAEPAPAVPAARWTGVVRPYSNEDVERLRGSVKVEHTLAQLGARRLWELLTSETHVAALGALSGAQAVQKYFADVGVEAKIEELEFGAFLAKRVQRTFDFTWMAVGPRLPSRRGGSDPDATRGGPPADQSAA